ncbi:MAG: DUF1553 domain-containing protein [Pirellulaceae bacterium]|nr:DUF1553 domain-containing protein [Pirellulaceae bacterium]
MATRVARFLWLVALLASPLRAQMEFVVLPQVISLTGQDAIAHLLIQEAAPNVEAAQAGGQRAAGPAIANGVTLQIAEPAIAKIENQCVIAVADGATELLVRVAGYDRIARVPVVVRGAGQPRQWQFGAHVQSILSRQGCNSGACHGALAGKGGFRLSLRGYDSDADHFAITAHDFGRRIEPADPTNSLLLTKPSLTLPHKGGLRLEPGTLDYRILAQWISAGAPGSQQDDARLTSIEVLPEAVQLEVDDSQPLVVLAHYADGRTEDVTTWARFSSSDETVARVDDKGIVQVVGRGRGAIVAWFASRIANTKIDVPYHEPYTHPAPSLVGDASQVSAMQRSGALQEFHPQNLIDRVLLDEWRSLGLAPSPICDDATFLRRAYLDATGALPTPEQVQQFLDDADPQRRPRLVDQLLGSPRFVDYWSYQWSDLLLVNGNLLRPKAVEAFYRWIRTQVQDNVPWDQFARQIVLARGDSLQYGATNFYAIHQTPEAMTENVCLAFMGLSIECAKCHNHPLEKWTNDQYYAMANLFSRVRAKGWGGDARNGDGVRTLVVLDRGDLIQPSRGRPQPPAALDSPPLDELDSEDRRISLATWLTAPENPYFSRAIVNRVWANFFGVGLIQPVDDLRSSNPASSPRLMRQLSDYLAQSGYDLRVLMRLIMNSSVYQLSSEATPLNRDDQRFFCRYYPRRLMAEVLHDAVVQVTNVPTVFKEIEFSGADKQPTDFYPPGTTALGLYDSAVANRFLQAFGRHQRRITCQCERSDQPTVVQVLHLSNGETINEKLASDACVLTDWLDSSLPLETIVQQAYIRTLSRRPATLESQRVVQELRDALAAGASPREALEDLLWSLLSSSEFLFAH